MSIEPGEVGKSGSTGNAKRILVVEDDRVVQRAVRDLLMAEGYEVLAALDGSEGMTQAQHAEPDLILLDLGLPSDPFGGGNFDGFGVMQWLGRRMTDKRVPIIVLTARHDQESRRRAFEFGASAYLTKPFQPPELLKAIRIVLDEI
jgi:DNA-binding response OmpR family regulator